jgi:hypothetical protein
MYGIIILYFEFKGRRLHNLLLWSPMCSRQLILYFYATIGDALSLTNQREFDWPPDCFRMVSYVVYINRPGSIFRFRLAAGNAVFRSRRRKVAKKISN